MLQPSVVDVIALFLALCCQKAFSSLQACDTGIGLIQKSPLIKRIEADQTMWAEVEKVETWFALPQNKETTCAHSAGASVFPLCRRFAHLHELSIVLRWFHHITSHITPQADQAIIPPYHAIWYCIVPCDTWPAMAKTSLLYCGSDHNMQTRLQWPFCVVVKHEMRGDALCHLEM